MREVHCGFHFLGLLYDHRVDNLCYDLGDFVGELFGERDECERWGDANKSFREFLEGGLTLVDHLTKKLRESKGTEGAGVIGGLVEDGRFEEGIREEKGRSERGRAAPDELDLEDQLLSSNTADVDTGPDQPLTKTGELEAG